MLQTLGIKPATNILYPQCSWEFLAPVGSGKLSREKLVKVDLASRYGQGDRVTEVFCNILSGVKVLAKPMT